MDSSVFTSIDMGSPSGRHNRGVMLNRLRQAFNAGVRNSPNSKVRRAVDENTLSIDTSSGSATDRINLSLFSRSTDQGFKRALYDAMVAGGDSGNLVGTDRKYAAAEYAQRRLAQYETEAYDAKIKKSQNDDSLSGLRSKSSLSTPHSQVSSTASSKLSGSTDSTLPQTPVSPTTETPAKTTTETPAKTTTETPANSTTETPANSTTETPAKQTVETPGSVIQQLNASNTGGTTATSIHPRGHAENVLVRVPLIYNGGPSTGAGGDDVADEDLIYSIFVPKYVADDKGFRDLILLARQDFKNRLGYGLNKDLIRDEQAEIDTLLRYYKPDDPFSPEEIHDPAYLIRYWLAKINGYKIGQDYKDGVMNELSDADFLFGLPAKEVLPHVEDRKARRALIEEPARRRRAEAWAAEQKAWEAEDAKASSNNSTTNK